jgi:predicted DNA-binding protein (UPF0251 family)
MDIERQYEQIETQEAEIEALRLVKTSTLD